MNESKILILPNIRTVGNNSAFIKSQILFPYECLKNKFFKVDVLTVRTDSKIFRPLNFIEIFKTIYIPLLLSLFVNTKIYRENSLKLLIKLREKFIKFKNIENKLMKYFDS